MKRSALLLVLPALLMSAAFKSPAQRVLKFIDRVKAIIDIA